MHSKLFHLLMLLLITQASADSTKAFGQGFRRDENGDVIAITHIGSLKKLLIQKDPEYRWHEFPKLELIDINQTTITEEQLQYLTKLKPLRELWLGRDVEPVRLVGSLQPLAKMRQLEVLRFYIVNVKEEDFAFVAQMPNLLDLTIEHGDDNGGFGKASELSDDVALHLQKSPALQYLEMRTDHDFTDRFITRIVKCKTLEWLRLSSPRFTDLSLHVLAKKSRLKYLEISSPQFTDEGIEAISQLPTLEALHVESRKLTRRSIQAVTKIKQLQGLTLHVSKLEDSDVQAIAALRELETLRLYSGSLNEECLRHFANHPKLRFLSLARLAKTRESLEILRSIKNLEPYYIKDAEKKIGSN